MVVERYNTHGRMYPVPVITLFQSLLLYGTVPMSYHAYELPGTGVPHAYELPCHSPEGLVW
jgi:hypothetical protein